MEPWDAQSLASEWPHIPWREPLPVTVGEKHALLCRICVANHGFKAEDIDDVPKTREAFDDHMRETHP